ncbi:50S ribosomal protein L13 [Oceanotoga sp. DSM 15011]|uniref:Large ribosomal subunit protein uL13 n=1 Tax=Oceanotoga teriensis TaxID=515440 RepID=A0AA45C658_9BACT|nr:MULTISPECIES: 50S ribosomal protein L13 [Oceanotoga]MDN5341746.1 large subunit ribosomal protein [Oceanotoga sp.]MDO7975658.1 50S ribosomal protein L13 [Oceanotoga teriensis]PWJ90593.1 LSU ribosomal protein L13P [Oceanotoga teriensis]UYO99838.1 50S ribosomal protein L13 [Oceanotoga sp. DSM 15011]
MNSKMTQKSFHAKKEDIDRKWYLVDAEGKTLGRLASQIAKVLQGKNKPIYTPSIDTGDFVVVINAEKINLTGKKMEQKEYYRHTGYPGGLKTTSVKEMLEKHPERVLEHAVKGMLPKNLLAKQMLKKLKIYAGTEHPHSAQNPELLDLK